VSEARPRYALTLEALPGDVPSERRLAGLLRVALRRFRLRCVSAKELPAAGGCPALGAPRPTGGGLSVDAAAPPPATAVDWGGGR
jgi:hypothetical protein